MRLASVLLVSTLVTGAAIPAALAADGLSAADKAFALMVNQGGMFEVKAGQLATTQGSTPVIRDQGNTEAHDHEGVGQRLKATAAEAGMTLPDDLDASFTKELDGLKALSGKAFDAAYLADMEKVHAKDGAAFAAEAKNGTDPKLKVFAAETHAIVEAHIGELKATKAR